MEKLGLWSCRRLFHYHECKKWFPFFWTCRKRRDVHELHWRPHKRMLGGHTWSFQGRYFGRIPSDAQSFPWDHHPSRKPPKQRRCMEREWNSGAKTKRECRKKYRIHNGGFIQIQCFKIIANNSSRIWVAAAISWPCYSIYRRIWPNFQLHSKQSRKLENRQILFSASKIGTKANTKSDGVFLVETGHAPSLQKYCTLPRLYKNIAHCPVSTKKNHTRRRLYANNHAALLPTRFSFDNIPHNQNRPTVSL